MIYTDDETAICMECGWEGLPEDLKIAITENKVNSKDHTTYEIVTCPKCGSELVEINND